MTRITLFSLVLTTGLACLPVTMHAQQDENPKDKKEDKGAPPHAGKPAPQVIQKQVTPHVNNVNNAVHTNEYHKPANTQVQSNISHNNSKTTFQKTNINTVNAQSVTTQNVQTRNHNGPAQFTPPQGTRANHYGGRWIAANDHPDWGNSGEHYWNHHHYRWYDGGWIIIDPGYVSVGGGSIGAAVQQRLSDQGYYNGPVDGMVGPGTSQAIANYQADHDLRPTGHINHHLLDSLGLSD